MPTTSIARLGATPTAPPQRVLPSRQHGTPPPLAAAHNGDVVVSATVTSTIGSTVSAPLILPNDCRHEVYAATMVAS